jgi:hypothetical protein
LKLRLNGNILSPRVTFSGGWPVCLAVFAMTKYLVMLMSLLLWSGLAYGADEPDDKKCPDGSVEKKPARTEAEKRKDEWKKLSPEEREAKRKEIKERLEKRIFGLRQKQTNNTITAQEARDLSRSEHILKRFEQNPPSMPRTPRAPTNAPAAPPPAEK